MKKNVILVSEYYTPHWTGIVVTCSYLAKSLIRQGHKVTVLTTKYDSSLPNTEKVHKVDVIRIPYLFKLSRTHYSPQLVFFALKIICNYDCVIINSPNSNVLWLSIITKMFGKKLIIFHQGDIVLPSQTGNQMVNRLIEKIFDCFSIPSFLMADKTSCCTDDYAKNSRVMKYSLNKFFPFVPSIKLPKTNHASSIKKTLDLLKQDFLLVGFAGRFVEEKGFDILYKSMPLVKKAIPKVHFVFAGAVSIDYEPFAQHIKKLMDINKKNVTYLGLLDRLDLSQFYKSLSVFVTSSRSDCFPTTQIEAAICKTPIVSTNIPGARMLVKETGFGEISKNHSHKALAESIIKVLLNRNLYNKSYPNVNNFIKKHDTFTIN